MQSSLETRGTSARRIHNNTVGSDKKVVVVFSSQLISNENSGFFNSSKKRTKNLCPSRLGQKFEFSSSFFGRIEDTKKTFRD